jgi:uncharacterized protein DUF4124
VKHGPIVIPISLALATSLAIVPSPAVAGRLHGGSDAGGHVMGGGRPFVSHPFVHRPFFGSPFFPHRFFGPFVPFGVIASPVVVFAPQPGPYAPPAYDGSSIYDDPPPAYSPPARGTVSLAPPPPNVIQYPTGRYELRGDGMNTPYTWVWIPNLPPPPPAGPSADTSAPGAPSPAGRSELYRWTDAEGVVHWTDRWDAVPEEYRKQAKKIRPS